MAPCKRKANSSPAREKPASPSKRTKTATKADADMETGPENNEAATPPVPRIQLSHRCKERLNELTRLLSFRTLGTTVEFFLPTLEGAKVITELARIKGYNNGEQTIDWLLPTQTKHLQELTTKLRFDRGGKTVDWLLPMASTEFLELTQLLGFQDGANTIKWLIDQAEPAIAAKRGSHHPASPSNITGHLGTYSQLVPPPDPTPQFLQNPQGVEPNPFRPTGGLGGAPRPTWHSSNFYTPAHRPFQSSTGPVTAHRSDLPIPNINGFSGAQSQMKVDDQFQRGYMSTNRMPNSASMNMQACPTPQSQISAFEGNWQQLPGIFEHYNIAGSRLHGGSHSEDNRFACTGNIIRPDTGIRKDQLQAPPQGFTWNQDLGGTWKTQSYSPAMQLPLQSCNTVSNHTVNMSSVTPAQDISRRDAHDPNQRLQNYFNGGQSPNGFQYTQSSEWSQTVGQDDAEAQNNYQSLSNGDRPFSVFNETRPQEDVNPVQQAGQPIDEIVDIEIEIQTEKEHEAIREMKDRKDGERNEGSAETTNDQGGATNFGYHSK